MNKVVRRKTGLRLLQGVGLITAAGGIIADWNKTHIFNPNWSPHARFHSAVAVFSGVFTGLSTIYLTGRKQAPSGHELVTAAAVPAAFFLSQAMSLAIPGVKGLDAEFPEALPKIRGHQINELHISLAMILLAGAGYWLARPSDNHLA